MGNLGIFCNDIEVANLILKVVFGATISHKELYVRMSF